MRSLVTKLRRAVLNWRSDFRRVAGNVMSLSALEFLNFFLPLLTLPYLFRILGPERFGLIAFAQVVMQWFDMLTGYGFNLTAARDIARCRDEPEQRSRVFCTVLVCKLVLLAAALGILLLLIGLSAQVYEGRYVFLATFGLVIGNALTPVWYFQGIERMRPLVVTGFACRAIATILVFATVSERSDYMFVPALNSIAAMAVGVVSLGVAFNSCGAALTKINRREVVDEFRQGASVFLAHFLTACYLYVPTLFLGFLHGNAAVGVYSPAHRIVNAISRMIKPVTTSLFPFVSRISAESRHVGYSVVVLSGAMGACLLLPVAVLLSAYSEDLVILVAGPEYPAAATVLRILAWVPLFGYLRRVFTVLGFVNFSQERSMLMITSIGLIGGVGVIFPLTRTYAGQGTAIGMLVTEAFIAVISVAVFVRVNAKPSRTFSLEPKVL